VRAESNGFCAGGDIKEMIAFSDKWELALTLAFLNSDTYRFPKPYISLVDGICMGGGVGLSLFGKYRVITENLDWAMPEARIGYINDNGGSHFLAKFPGKIGLYIALTAARIKAEDAMYCGIGTHFVPSADIEPLRQALTSRDISSTDSIEAVLQQFTKTVQGKSNLQELQATIDHCFGADTVEGIIERLQENNSHWAQATTKALLRNSPTSLKLIMESQRRAQSEFFERALVTQLRVMARLFDHNDPQVGIPAMSDRSKPPQWSPSRVEDVKQEYVEAFFLPLDDSKEDQLPVDWRGGYSTDDVNLL